MKPTFYILNVIGIVYIIAGVFFIKKGNAFVGYAYIGYALSNFALSFA
jgi:uncharacterized membrane protein YozB (DUF420 family)